MSFGGYTKNHWSLISGVHARGSKRTELHCIHNCCYGPFKCCIMQWWGGIYIRICSDKRYEHVWVVGQHSQRYERMGGYPISRKMAPYFITFIHDTLGYQFLVVTIMYSRSPCPGLLNVYYAQCLPRKHYCIVQTIRQIGRWREVEIEGGEL